MRVLILLTIAWSLLGQSPEGLFLGVIVSKDWLLRPYEKRVEDAGGASVFLLNRNVRKVRFQWDDGTPIVQFDQGVANWFDPTKMPGGGKAP